MKEEAKPAVDALSPLLKTLKERGMPVATAYFKAAVRNENQMSKTSLMATRKATMTLTSAGLLIEQKGHAPILTENHKYLEME